MRKYIFDIDNTILEVHDGDYKNAQPIQYRIDIVNRLYRTGNHITYWTARGARSKVDWCSFTEKQLADFGCLYHTLRCDKPDYDIWVDDKAINASVYFD